MSSAMAAKRHASPQPDLTLREGGNPSRFAAQLHHEIGTR
jgi:hypothetical protein